MWISQVFIFKKTYPGLLHEEGPLNFTFKNLTLTMVSKTFSSALHFLVIIVAIFFFSLQTFLFPTFENYNNLRIFPVFTG